MSIAQPPPEGFLSAYYFPPLGFAASLPQMREPEVIGKDGAVRNNLTHLTPQSSLHPFHVLFRWPSPPPAHSTPLFSASLAPF